MLSQNRVFLAIFFRFTNKQSLAWGIVRKTVRHETRNTVKIVLSLSLESFQHTGQMFTGSHSVICTDRDLHSCFCFFIWVFFFFCFFLELHLWHMEVPRLGVELELQLPAYSIATAMWDPSQVCNLHRSSQQCQILDPLSKARNRTHILMDTSQIPFQCTSMGTPLDFHSCENWAWHCFHNFIFGGSVYILLMLLNTTISMIILLRR